MQVTGAWCGFYDYYTSDQNAILGWHPDAHNIMLCNGFSGHGLQQSPAAGRAVAELLTEGAFVSLDLSLFRPQRFREARLVFEENIV